MKRIIILLMCLVLFLTSCGVKEENSFSHKKLDIKLDYDLFDFALSGDGNIYISDKDKIVIINQDGIITDEIIDSLGFCRIISYSNNKLYAFDDFSNCIKEYSYDNKLTSNYSINIAGFLKKMRINKDKAFLLQSDKENYMKQYITTYNMNSNEYYELPFTNVITFTLYDSNRILLLLDSHSSDNIIIWDYKENKISQKYNIPISATNIEYNKNDKMMYCSKENTVLQLDLEKGEWNSLISAKNVSLESMGLYNNLCFLSDKEKTLHIFNLDNYKLNSSDTITIISSNPAIDRDSMMRSALDKFNEEYSYAKVIFKFINFKEYNTELIKRFTSGDDSFDIFFINADDSFKYIKNEVMADLSIFPQINTLFKEMHEGIEELCTYNRKIVGIPWNMDFSALQINDQLLNKLKNKHGISTLNWDGLYKLSKECRFDLNNDGVYDTYCFEYNKQFFGLLIADLSCSIYFNQFHGTATFNNDDFKNLLIVSKKMWEEHLILEKNDYTMHSEKKDNILFYPSDNFSISTGDWTYTPMIGEERTYPIGITFLSVNNRSKNKMLSVELLAAIISQEKPNMLPLFPNVSNNKVIKQNDEVYRNILKHGVRRNFNSDLYMFIAEKIEEYIDDKITIEETVNSINSKAQMIVNE